MSILTIKKIIIINQCPHDPISRSSTCSIFRNMKENVAAGANLKLPSIHSGSVPRSIGQKPAHTSTPKTKINGVGLYGDEFLRLR